MMNKQVVLRMEIDGVHWHHTLDEATANRCVSELSRGFESFTGGSTITVKIEDLELSPIDLEACPGCGCMPGDGRTQGCTHPDGCGYFDEHHGRRQAGPLTVPPIRRVYEEL